MADSCQVKNMKRVMLPWLPVPLQNAQCFFRRQIREFDLLMVMIHAVHYGTCCDGTMTTSEVSQYELWFEWNHCCEITNLVPAQRKWRYRS